jgi:hypothetical protein
MNCVSQHPFLSIRRGEATKERAPNWLERSDRFEVETMVTAQPELHSPSCDAEASRNCGVRQTRHRCSMNKCPVKSGAHILASAAFCRSVLPRTGLMVPGHDGVRNGRQRRTCRLAFGDRGAAARSTSESGCLPLRAGHPRPLAGTPCRRRCGSGGCARCPFSRSSPSVPRGVPCRHQARRACEKGPAMPGSGEVRPRRYSLQNLYCTRASLRKCENASLPDLAEFTR